VSKALPHSAFHECGHEVAARVLGIAVESVTVIPDENYERGEVFSAALTVLVEPLKLHDHASVETAALILLAGETAQKKFAARSIIREEDYEADRATLNGLVSESELSHLLQKTQELIEEHWHEVTELAQELLRKGWIDFEKKANI
jgi:hypothetical protein